jgi:hypothetical protein
MKANACLVTVIASASCTLRWLFTTGKGFAVLFVLLLVMFFLTSADLAPTVSIPSPEAMTFGPLVADTIAEVRIPVSNRGLLPLRIENVKTGCACMQHSLDKTLLHWGESAVIAIHYDLKRKMPGTTREIVVLQTNDWNHPLTQFHVVVLVEGRGWRVLPSDLLAVADGTQKTVVTAQALYEGSASERIRAVRSDSTHILPRVVGQHVFPKSGRRLYDIAVECDALFDGYEHRGRVFIETERSGSSPLSLPVTIRRSAIAASPSPVANNLGSGSSERAGVEGLKGGEAWRQRYGYHE